MSQVNINYAIAENLRVIISPRNISVSASLDSQLVLITSEYSEELDIGAHIAEHSCSMSKKE